MTEKKTQAAIGEALRSLRGDRSAAEAAKAIGISEPSLLAYERGEWAPRDEVKARIAKFYGTPVETIFNVNDEEGENTMSNIEKKFDSESVIHEMEDRLIYPLEYLQEAMTHAAAEAVGKYEFESNADAFGLACLLRVFADQLKAINDNSSKAIETVTEIVKNAGAVD